MLELGGAMSFRSGRASSVPGRTQCAHSAGAAAEAALVANLVGKLQLTWEM